MREPTERELFLQNNLATAAVLLYRASRAMAVGSAKEQQLLVIECNQWFSEMRESLSGEISSEETQKATSTSAPPAERLGEGWKSPLSEPTSSPPGLVKTTETPSTEGVPSSTESAGSITPPRRTSLTPSQKAAMNFFLMK